MKFSVVTCLEPVMSPYDSKALWSHCISREGWRSATSLPPSHCHPLDFSCECADLAPIYCNNFLGRVGSLNTLVWRKILWEDSKFTLKKFPLISLPFKKKTQIPQWHLSVGLVGGWQGSETLGKTRQWRYLPCLRWWISCHREDLWEERKGEKNCDYPVLSYFHVSCCSPHEQMRR